MPFLFSQVEYCDMHYVYGYCDGTPLDYYLWGHMKTLVYETKVDSRAALRDRIFAAADHIRNYPHNISSATESLLIRAENCIATGGRYVLRTSTLNQVLYFS